MDSVSGFSVGVTRDAIGFSIGNIAEDGFGSPVTLSRGNGGDIAAAVAVGAAALVVTNVGQNIDVAASATATVLKFTTGASTFTDAIGTGSFAITDANFAATEAMAAVWYDTDTSEAVFGTLRNSSAGGGQLNDLDAFAEAARLGMSAADFAALNNQNMLFYV